MRPTRLTVPALGASLVLLVSACGDDSSRASEEPGGETSSSTPSQTTETPATPVELIDFGQEPKVKADYKKVALRAVRDDLITMVPTTLPDGWTTVGGGYQRDPQWWHMEFTAPSGDVTLDQFAGDTKTAMADQSGLTEAGDVDLSAWGTGTWPMWESDGGAVVLTHELKGSTVIVQGADQESVEELAKSLLPAEDAPEQDG